MCFLVSSERSGTPEGNRRGAAKKARDGQGAANGLPWPFVLVGELLRLEIALWCLLCRHGSAVLLLGPGLALVSNQVPVWPPVFKNKS